MLLLKQYNTNMILKPFKVIGNVFYLFKIISHIKIEHTIIKNKQFTNIIIPENILINTHNLIILSENCTIQSNVDNNGKIYLNPYDKTSLHKKYMPITKPINFVKFSEL